MTCGRGGIRGLTRGRRGRDVASVEAVDDVVTLDHFTRRFNGAAALCGLSGARGPGADAIAGHGAGNRARGGGCTVAAAIADLVAEHTAGDGADGGAGVIAVGIRVGDGVTGHGAGGGADGSRHIAAVAVADLAPDQGAGEAAEYRRDDAAFLGGGRRGAVTLLARFRDAFVDGCRRNYLCRVNDLAGGKGAGAAQGGDEQGNGFAAVHDGLLEKFGLGY